MMWAANMTLRRASFDHHQRPNPVREDEQPYSSFGLIWKHYGHEYLRALEVPEADLDDIHASFEQSFVLPIDLMDNGAMNPSVAGPLTPLTLSVLLESLKPVFDNRSSDADDKAFAEALPIARAFVEASIAKKAAKRRAEAIVTKAISDAGPSRILELPMGMPFRSAIEATGADHLLFVVNPRDDDWSIGGIRISGDSFEQRARFACRMGRLDRRGLGRRQRRQGRKVLSQRTVHRGCQ